MHVGVETHFQPATKAHPAFAVREIDLLFCTLTSAGAECVWDSNIGEVRRFYANDPWGNRLEFTEALAPVT